jgi:hypothetical protein
MRRFLVRFSESEASNHTPSLADFTTTTPELKFSVHTAYMMVVCAVRYEPVSTGISLLSGNLITDRARNEAFGLQEVPIFPGCRTVLAVETLPQGTEFLDAATGDQESTRETSILFLKTHS